MTTTDDAAWMLRHHDGETHGPYTLQVLVDAASGGNIAEDSEVMHEMHTRGQWVAASLIPPIALAMQKASESTQPPFSSPFGAIHQNETKHRQERFGLTSNVPTTFLDACWGLIDFRFQTFITPWIIRVYWVFAVIVTVLSLIFGAASVVTFPFRPAGALASSDSTSASKPRERIVELSNGDYVLERQQPDRIGDFVEAIVRFIVSVVMAIMVLITIRMILEIGIVVFCIAADLRAIRDQTA